jgi:uncharacterized membrane protein
MGLKLGTTLTLALAIAFLLSITAVPASSQTGYVPRSISVVVQRDGSVSILYTVQVNQSSAAIPLLGFDQNSASTLKVVDGGNRTISYSEKSGVLTVNSASGALITASYNSFKLTSKNGTGWTIQINSPVSWSATFPLDTNITGWSAQPTYYYKGVPPYFVFPAGSQWVDYKLSYEELRPAAWFIPSPEIAVAGGVSVALGVSFLLMYQRYRWNLKGRVLVSKNQMLNEEEKRILIFLSKKRGKAFETELARSLELSRTSAWRHVRNLEDQGLVVTEKLGSQNLVRIKP